ncbi:unnamed protein product [Trichobilharzia szidati]|nr:unnamed protein product [Trichobilharzia szidati]CAH8853115.1 unnamed protein product [Trichobilharzia szidati]
MPSSKGATKPSSSNIPPTFNIANILSPETQTETSRSRQNGDDTEITENIKCIENTQPILNNRDRMLAILNVGGMLDEDGLVAPFEDGISTITHKLEEFAGAFQLSSCDGDSAEGNGICMNEN